MTDVHIIADSKNEFGQRCISAICTFPRYLLAEINTHRMLSRNSASSRAIRFEKMVESVQKNPFIPSKWQKDHAGMQGTEYFSQEEVNTKNLVPNWLAARDKAIGMAQVLSNLGVTKQICNRLLEPFMYHTALITATELENFFALRAHDMAEVHLQELAYKYLEACNKSEPKKLKAGEWHIPFGDSFDNATLLSVIPADKKFRPQGMLSSVVDDETLNITMVKLATVRCARISYVTPGSEQKINYAADLELHDRLAGSGHWSAFEHCARAMDRNEFYHYINGHIGHHTSELNMENPKDVYGWCGNFRGFIQYRKMFENENRSDSRLLKK
jgi:thymidylate synthase ThyX